MKKALAAAACLAASVFLLLPAYADEVYRGYTQAPAGMTDVGQPAAPKAASAMKVLSYPMNIAAAGDGSYLVTDTGNKIIWQVSGGLDSIIAGNASAEDIYRQAVGGYKDDQSRESLFAEPWGIAPFLDGYAVSDAANNVVRLVKTSEGVTRTAAAISAGFKRPTGLAAGDDGSLYISDTLNGCIRKMDTSGKITTWLGGLNEPTGLCFANGSLYICEAGAGRIVKSAGGAPETVADGLDNPQGVTVAREDGTVYISDTGNHRVLKLTTEGPQTLIEGDPAVLGEMPVSPCGLLAAADKLMICDNFLQQLIVISR